MAAIAEGDCGRAERAMLRGCLEVSFELNFWCVYDEMDNFQLKVPRGGMC